jgi:chaperone BCS1
LQWITQQSAKQARHLSLRTMYVQHDNGSISTQFRFVPGPGRHWFRWENVWFQACTHIRCFRHFNQLDFR